MLYKIAEKVIELEKKGKRIIKFNVGDPDQPPHPQIIKTALKAMKEGKTKYGSAKGEKELREKIAKIYGVNIENVIITPGSKWAIFAIMSSLLKKGDNIILPTPHWTAYEMIAKKLGIKIKFLTCELESDWQIDVEKLEDLIDKNTKLIILNSPHNPTSKIIREEIFERIVNLANKKGIQVLSDETYSDISFKKQKSILDFEGNHIYINSFSKTFAMTGWRLGFAIVPRKLAEKIVELNQITITSVPSFIQEAGIKALQLKREISKKMKEIYRKRANLACKILSKTKFKFSKPDAPFYLFIKCFSDSEKLALDLLSQGVAITPGTAFGNFREYFRIALTLPDREIKKGLQIIASHSH